MAKLVTSKDGEITVFTLPADEAATIGREPACAIRLDSTQISRRHCRLDPLPGGRYRLVDHVSTNGTFLNGQRVTSVVLEDFDRIRIGDSDLVYVSDDVDPDDALEFRFVGDALEDERALLESGATWSALRFDRAGRRYAFKERVLQLSVANREVLSEEDALPLLDALLDEVLRFTRFESGAVLLERGAEGELEVLFRRPEQEPGPDAESDEVLRQVVAEAVSTGRVVERSLSGPVAFSSGGRTGGAPLRDVVCVPLDPIRGSSAASPSEVRLRPEAPLGAFLLTTSNPQDPLPTPDRRLLEMAAAQAAIALQRARLYRAATVDHLTQLANRACTGRMLEEGLARARSEGSPFAALLFDLDHFKEVNDTYGHQVGDEVLRRIAQRARRVLRKADLVGRWGGEEFLVLLPGVGLAGAQRVAAKLARAVASHPIGDAGVQVTISLGVAVFPEHAETGSELVKRADQALYTAKAMGRNRYVAYQPEVDIPQTSSAAREPIDSAAKRTARLKAAAWGYEGELATQHVPMYRAEEAWLVCPPLEPVPLGGRPALTLGREAACDLCLPHLEVARLHATLRRGSDGLLLEPCGGRALTYLNGFRLEAAAPVLPGDLILIGPYLLQVHEAAPATVEGPVDGIRRGAVTLLEDLPLPALLEQLRWREVDGALEVRAGELRALLRLRGGAVVKAAIEAEALDRDEVLARLGALTAGIAVLAEDSEVGPSHADLLVQQTLVLKDPRARRTG